MNNKTTNTTFQTFPRDNDNFIVETKHGRRIYRKIGNMQFEAMLLKQNERSSPNNFNILISREGATGVFRFHVDSNHVLQNVYFEAIDATMFGHFSSSSRLNELIDLVQFVDRNSHLILSCVLGEEEAFKAEIKHKKQLVDKLLGTMLETRKEFVENVRKSIEENCISNLKSGFTSDFANHLFYTNTEGRIFATSPKLEDQEVSTLMVKDQKQFVLCCTKFIIRKMAAKVIG